MKKYFLLLVLVVVAGLVYVSLSINDQPYILSDKSYQLEGQLTTRLFYGPPNYGENPDTDEKVYPYLLKLKEPISITSEDGLDSFELDEFHLVVINKDHFKFLEEQMGNNIDVKGQFFLAHTGHHRTPVLIEIESLSTK